MLLIRANKIDRSTFIAIIAVCLWILFPLPQFCCATTDYLKLQEELARQERETKLRKKAVAQGVQFISVYEALEKFEAGQMLLLDVNSKGFYECEHIVGAIHGNVDKIRIKLPKHVEIGIYCR